jgi:hypothetical protein
MFRRISDVPPSIEFARTRRNAYCNPFAAALVSSSFGRVPRRPRCPPEIEALDVAAGQLEIQHVRRSGDDDLDSSTTPWTAPQASPPSMSANSVPGQAAMRRTRLRRQVRVGRQSGLGCALAARGVRWRRGRVRARPRTARR